ARCTRSRAGRTRSCAGRTGPRVDRAGSRGIRLHCKCTTLALCNCRSYDTPPASGCEQVRERGRRRGGMMPNGSPTFAIVGGGAMGAALVGLLVERLASKPWARGTARIALFEKAERVGPGLAYA